MAIAPLACLDLFTGIAGFVLGLEDFCNPIGYCDIDTHAHAILTARMADGHIPPRPIFPDVTQLRAADLEQRVDIITGGFPCQDVSNMGNQNAAHTGTSALAKSRTGLVEHVLRLAVETAPSFIFLENVCAITRDPMYTHLVQRFVDAGYDGHWDRFSAARLGFPHQRNRWFFLARRRDCPRAATLAAGIHERLSSNVLRDRRVHTFRSDVPLRAHGPGIAHARGLCRRVQALGNAVVPDVVRFAFVELMMRLQRATPPNPALNMSAIAGTFGLDGIRFVTPFPIATCAFHKPIIILPDRQAGAVNHKRSTRARMTEPMTRRQFSTPRHGSKFGVRSITHRTCNDLPLQLIFWDKTPEPLRALALMTPVQASP